MKKAVVLLSGGMDSAVCLALAEEQGYVVYAITYNYGQRNIYEIEAAKELARIYKVEEHMEFNVDLRKIGGSALTDDIEVPGSETEGAPVTYVPARNIVFLSIAAGWAEVIGADTVFIGANVRDYSGYPDCRPGFLESFETAVNQGTKDETQITIKAPLINMSKAQIVEEGRRLDVDLSITRSCYDPGPGGEPCGKCDSCRLREKGFKEVKTGVIENG
ncbi:7-cyano-7-deazaguanine synthase QueC [Elusimicrobiota bacterium]